MCGRRSSALARGRVQRIVCRISGRCQPPPLCRSRVGLADHKTTLPTPRSDCPCDTYQIPVPMPFKSSLLVDGDCIFVSVLHLDLLVRKLVWQTATPIDVAAAVLRPNRRANGTCSLVIKPHVQHLIVVSFSPIMAHLLICFGVRDIFHNFDRAHRS